MDTAARAAVVAREDERVRGGVMGREAMLCKPTEVGQLVKIQEAENQSATPMTHSQPVLDFCPSKHFFCGIARKLGCHFCATK
jgi:hypothetical protein